MSIKTIPAFHSWFYRTGHLNFFHKLLRAHNKMLNDPTPSNESTKQSIV